MASSILHRRNLGLLIVLLLLRIVPSNSALYDNYDDMTVSFSTSTEMTTTPMTTTTSSTTTSTTTTPTTTTTTTTPSTTTTTSTPTTTTTSTTTTTPSTTTTTTTPSTTTTTIPSTTTTTIPSTTTTTIPSTTTTITIPPTTTTTMPSTSSTTTTKATTTSVELNPIVDTTLAATTTKATTLAPSTPIASTSAPSTPVAGTLAPSTPIASTITPSTPIASTLAPSTPLATSMAPSTPLATTITPVASSMAATTITQTTLPPATTAQPPTTTMTLASSTASAITNSTLTAQTTPIVSTLAPTTATIVTSISPAASTTLPPATSTQPPTTTKAPTTVLASTNSTVTAPPTPTVGVQNGSTTSNNGNSTNSTTTAGTNPMTTMPATTISTTKTIRIILRGAELGEVRILGQQQRYAIVYTASTLILADMWTGLSSEIVWQSGGNEKFYLDNESVAYIVNAGEINFVEYGRDELAGWIRTERANPHQISVRLRRTKSTKNAVENGQNNFQSQNVDALEIRRVAYLLDARTISIVDMAKNTQIAQIQHGNAIDWLELNERANKLLFRDIRAALHLYSLETGQTNHLIGHSSYVQWVPQSDVVVAQSNDQLCIWYNTDEHTDRVVQFQIQGEVEMVARDSTRTEVIVLENNSRVAYELDSTMIEFGTALDELDLGRAVLFLEQSEQRGMDVQAMWRKLASIALEHSQLMVAQRCFASLNDLVRVQFLQETLLRAERQFGAPMDEAAVASHFEVRARLAMMAKQFKRAERIWLENNALSEAIEMWRRLGDWEAAMELARAMNRTPYAPNMNGIYTKLDNRKRPLTEIKMREGDQWAALELYLNASQPAQAVQLLLDNRTFLSQIALKSSSEGTEDEMGGISERIFQELERHEMFDKAGELHEALDQHDKAFELYCRGHLYGKAIQIARLNFPERVVQLEEQWADWLFGQGIYDVAIPHYLESGNTIRAIDSAIHAREWEKALEILDALEQQPSEYTAPFFAKIAQHFELSGELDKAESLYVNAGKLAESIEMYNKAGRWVDAFKLAAELFGIEQSRELYTEKAAQLVEEKKLADAEKLFIALGEPNKAISMYKEADRTEDMMRLMGQFHADEVQNAHKRLAEELEAKGDLRAAEEQFLLAGNWAAAVDMYQQAEQWADAHRLAKAEGGERAQKQIVYLWAKSLGGDAAVKLLTRHDQLEEAIGMAVTKSDFEFAFELCRLGAGHRLQFVQQKYAEHLEDEGELDKAEEHYLKAGKAREAVLMHTHNQNWDAAERIAQEHCPEQLPELFVQRARVALEQRDYARAESFLLRANRPGIILAFYRESAMWPEALRIARDYLPDELQQCQSDYEDFQLRSGAKGAQSLVAQAKEWERQNEYRRAVECYMRLGMDDTMVAQQQQQDQQLVAQSLAKAAEIIVKFLGDSEDGMDLLVRIGQRQMELRQFLGAGETFLLANRPTESIEALLDAHEWAKAKRVAEELAPEMEQTVEETYRQFLRTHGRIGELIDVDVVAAIDMLVQAGQWEKALQTARQQNHRSLLDKYLATYSTELLADGQHEQLLRILRKFGATPNPQLLPIYSNLVEKLLNERPNANTNNYELLAILRDLLLEVTRQMGTLTGNEPQSISQQTILLFDRYLHLAHFCALRKALELAADQQNGQDGSEALRLRLNLVMPRYIEPLRPDKAFYEAGSACKLLGGPTYESMAFLLLNQYLDITDAIDEDDPNLVDNALFEGTDIPTSYALPRDKYLTEAEHEEMKEWVLAISVGQNVEKLLRMDDRDSYEASTLDSLGNLYPICVISGFPVIDEGHELGHGLVADHRAWATFTALVKQWPTDELFDVQQFLANWSMQ